MQKFIFFFLLVLSSGLGGLQAQINNRLANVLQADSCQNWLKLSNIEGLAIDTSEVEWLLLCRPFGAVVDRSDSPSYGSLLQRNGAGDYEIHQIVGLRGDTVFLKDQIQYQPSPQLGYTAYAVVQRDLSGILLDQAVLDAAITVNPISMLGLVFLPALEDLQMAGVLDRSGEVNFVSGNGGIQDSQCGAFTSASAYAYPSGNWRGARKGLGITPINGSGNDSNGRGAWLNGGGGGNDHNAGGGGGGLAGRGGDGASNEEPGLFNCSGNFPGIGGYAVALYGDNGQPLLFAGAEGGAGHANNTNSAHGGKGGGAFVLYARSIHFSGEAALLVNGQDGSDVNGDGGGGGGSGGSVFLLADTITGSASLELRGGRGGHVNNSNANRCFGPGGGGGGGRFVSRVALDGDFNIDISGGNGGESQNSQACAPGENVGQDGQDGLIEIGDFQPLALAENLGVPRLRLLEDTVCADEAFELEAQLSRSCFRIEWWLQTEAGQQSLLNNPNFLDADSERLRILSLPALMPGDTFLLRQYNLINQIVMEQRIVFPPATQPTAAFDFAVTGSALQITANNSSLANSFVWDFGDGNGNTEATPSHSYTQSGLYTIQLIAIGNCGSDTITALVEILAPALAAQFQLNQDTFCLGDTLRLENASLNSSSIRWDISPRLPIGPSPQSAMATVLLSAPGSFVVQLTAFNDSGDSSQISQTITVFDTASYVLSSEINGLDISLNASGSGGENPYFITPPGDTILGTNLTFTAPAPGEYAFLFQASNNRCGDFSQTITLSVSAPLLAIATASLNVGCAPLTTTISNNSSGDFNQVSWEVLPNAAAVSVLLDSPGALQVRLEEAGNYTVILSISGPGGSASMSLNILVNTTPTAAFTVVENQGLISLTNLSADADSYLWDFGDGNGSDAFEPSHQYSAPGLYEITLNASNGGCSRAVNRSVLVDNISQTTDFNPAQILLYPNPSQGVLQLESPALRYQWFTAEGRSLGTEKAKAEGNSTLSIQPFPQGIYWLKLVLPQGVYWRKVIKR